MHAYLTKNILACMRSVSYVNSISSKTNNVLHLYSYGNSPTTLASQTEYKCNNIFTDSAVKHNGPCIHIITPKTVIKNDIYLTASFSRRISLSSKSPNLRTTPMLNILRLSIQINQIHTNVQTLFCID